MAMLVLMLGALPVASSAPNCRAAPALLPITNITYGGGAAANRGIRVKVGGQVLNLRPTTLLNEIRVRNGQDCSEISVPDTRDCFSEIGSLFSPENSTSFHQTNIIFISAVDHLGHITGEALISGYDKVQLHGGDIGLPVEVWSSTRGTNRSGSDQGLRRSGLPLGPESSVIKRLLDTGAIPSRVLGLFFGSRSQTRGADGELVIGGIDIARIKDIRDWSYHTIDQQLPHLCPLQVRVKDIRLGNIRGSFTLLEGSDVDVNTCVDPWQNEITFPQSVYEQWAKLTEHPTKDSHPWEPPFTEQTYPLGNEDLIDNLTIVLNDGFETVIPHRELVSQERGSDKEGRYAILNASRMMAAVTSGDHMILGGVYLSQVYLQVDYNRRSFGLTSASIGTKDREILAMCDGIVRLSTGARVGIVTGMLTVAVTSLVFFYAIVNQTPRKTRLRGPTSSSAPGVYIAQKRHKKGSTGIPASSSVEGPEVKSGNDPYPGHRLGLNFRSAKQSLQVQAAQRKPSRRNNGPAPSPGLRDYLGTCIGNGNYKLAQASQKGTHA
ncbi:hypothetical protein GP486_004792 [Trichoglossum hirsutum]|uniref:Peptidase A1 domain-containing protein n=1 Tax=Trichoglossum hirsutum TaxID=265104 RepID=A0A9P8LAE8_9PEZI|nr:hypothetical protein GP486_004792 [Trichoglossum hirsutum]